MDIVNILGDLKYSALTEDLKFCLNISKAALWINCSIFLATNMRVIDSVKVQLEREILLGQTAQDVATVLGAPSKVFYKSEDKMRIHSSNAHRKTTTAIKSDYFFNYFTLGMVREFLNQALIIKTYFFAKRKLTMHIIISNRKQNFLLFKIYQILFIVIREI